MQTYEDPEEGPQELRQEHLILLLLRQEDGTWRVRAWGAPQKRGL
jgi:hypothetical protein